MKIVVGSKNPTKIGATTVIFPEAEVMALDVPSNVSLQPRSDQETRQGAINRAVQCKQSSANAYGIGLEGGVMEIAGSYFLCNWGAFVTPEEQLFTASGARIILPDDVARYLDKGMELGDVMDDYARRKDVRKHEGAIGIFSNGRLKRQEMFSQIVTLLRGQWEFSGEASLSIQKPPFQRNERGLY